MKKLSLKNLNLAADQILGEKHLKTVFGGTDNCNCIGWGTNPNGGGIHCTEYDCWY
ncbi:hypothetical protein [Ulvibacterium sp.]|uniref:hypothetical protein n=1 Tax=Ulvibacterium sp. TaxID=2665914 RepID=UPI003BAD7CF4